MKKYAILFFIFVATTPTYSRRPRPPRPPPPTEIIIDLHQRSGLLWHDSGWNTNYDAIFNETCSETFQNIDEGMINRPGFCGVDHPRIKNEEWKRPFIKAFTNLQDFYHPFLPKRGKEATFIKKYLEEFIKTRIGRRLYILMMEPDPDYVVERRPGESRVSYYWDRSCYIYSVLSADNDDEFEPISWAEYRRFFDYLKKLWFGDTAFTHLIPKGRLVAWRHVFVGDQFVKSNKQGRVEIKPDKMKGFHNWYQFYRLLCIKHNPYSTVNNRYYFTFDYKAEDNPNHQQQPTDKEVRFCDVSINWDLMRKGKSTILFGSRPEYDFAVFSLCFQEHKYHLDAVNEGNGAENEFEINRERKCRQHLGNNMYISAVGNTDPDIYKIKGNSEISTAYFAH